MTNPQSHVVAQLFDQLERAVAAHDGAGAVQVLDHMDTAAGRAFTSNVVQALISAALPAAKF